MKRWRAEPSRSTALGEGEHRHDDQRERREDDADRGVVGFAVDKEEVAYGLDDHIGGEHKEADGDQPKRDPLAVFVVAAAELATELPHDDDGRAHFDGGVEPEAHERDRSGSQARGDGDSGFNGVPGDRERGEQHASPLEGRSWPAAVRSRIDGRGSELFVGIGTPGPTHPDAGEVVFDDDGTVLARRWCWRQSSTAAVGTNTTNALFVVEAHHASAANDIAAAAAELEALVREHLAPTRVTRTTVE